MENNKTRQKPQLHPKWEKEMKQIAAILEKAPLQKTIKWASEVYTYNGKNVVSYGGFNHFFSLWFYNGVFLEDPYKVLITASDGKTKSLRQWRFTSAAEIDEEKILAYVYEAIEVEKKGLKIQPEKPAPLQTPQLLEEALQADEQLKAAFEHLTPGRQKEYILYLNEAKQEATRHKRLEKIKPMILQGTGLNDKYK